MTRARRWWVAVALAVALALGAVGSVLVYRWQMPRVRQQLVAILAEQLDARVELADLQVLPGREVTVVGRGLVLHHRAVQGDRPPLVRIERFVVRVPALAILRRPIHVRSVELEQLAAYLPRRRAANPAPAVDGAPGAVSASDTAPPAAEAPEVPEVPEASVRSRLRESMRGPSPVVIDALTSTDATLTIESGKPDRPPRVFEIHDLRLLDAAFDRPVTFEATLTNPKPTGRIEAGGQFGPWVADEPSASAISGTYRFARADLGTIKGIGGTLESTGGFGGVLDQIDVKGETRTADFSLDIGGTPLPLTAAFVALVDGTNGNTILHDVTAVLGRTPIAAKGGVVHTPGRKGRTVVLEAKITGGQLPDVLRLALDEAEPPMDGTISLTSLINLPPGDTRVAERLELNGEFTIEGLTFASDAVQDKVDEFSRRGRGQPANTAIRDVASTMRGGFALKDGVLRFSGLRFGVRGALVQLRGYYVLRGGALDFRGTVRLDARASQTMTGWKSWVTKAFDPLLARDGAGTVLPIKIEGTARQPKFGVEVKKIF